MIIENAKIQINVIGGASFTFCPGSPGWDEAIGLLRGHYDDSEISDPCLSIDEVPAGWLKEEIK